MESSGCPSLGAVALLSDGRFPVGGHAHSAGFEGAATVFDLREPEALRSFLVGRLHTTGVTEAHLVAALAHQMVEDTIDWTEADVEINARIASPALRSTSRLLGRQWLRAARRLFAGPLLDAAMTVSDHGPHQAMAFAATATEAGLAPAEAVGVHLHHLVSTITTAAVRLHGHDPYDAARLQADQIERCQAITAAAMSSSTQSWCLVPAPSGPLTEILAERHAVAETRLFRS